MQLDEQNSKISMRMLAAQRQLYIDAKRAGMVRIFLATVSFLMAPIFVLLYPGIRNTVAIIVGLLLISTLILRNIETQKIRTAATIQEEFDTRLLMLPWNEILVGSKVSKELIINANRRFKGDREKLKNWYPDVDIDDLPMKILLCQKSNLVWDWRLRQVYSALLAVITSMVILAQIMLAYNGTVKYYLLGFLFPSLPLLLLGFERMIQHYSIAQDKKRLEHTVLGLLEKRKCTMNNCRTIQDKIYVLRTNTALVPDWFYYLFRNNFESDMQQATNELNDEL